MPRRDRILKSGETSEQSSGTLIESHCLRNLRFAPVHFFFSGGGPDRRPPRPVVGGKIAPPLMQLGWVSQGHHFLVRAVGGCLEDSDRMRHGPP